MPGEPLRKNMVETPIEIFEETPKGILRKSLVINLDGVLVEVQEKPLIENQRNPENTK